MSFAVMLVLALAGSAFACCVWFLYDLIQAQADKIDYLSSKVGDLARRLDYLEKQDAS